LLRNICLTEVGVSLQQAIPQKPSISLLRVLVGT